jgi:hypothetical protein
LEQIPCAKLTSQDSLCRYVSPTRRLVQSGEGFRKKVLQINALLTLLTIKKINAPAVLKPIG